jgi:tetratricopeptide (TPR) repeat protein
MPGKSFCSGCGREPYCGSACQKLDWKIHKSMCPILKKLSNTQLQPYDEAIQVIMEILASKKNDIRFLEHLLSYAEYQFGQNVPGKDYRERTDGQRIVNWDVEINSLLEISNMMMDVIAATYSSVSTIRDEEIFPHLERSLHILSPWMITIDTDDSNQYNSLSFEQVDHSLKMSFNLERKMAILAINRNQFDVSEGHCQRCLVNSRRLSVEGEEKTTLCFSALNVYITLRESQGDFSGAVTFAEEAYNLVVDAYDPAHPQVQEAAGFLIKSLTQKGDLSNAERFAEQTYANLRDVKNGMDQEGEQIAYGAYNWADVIFKQDNGDLIKAEGLVEEAIRIINKFVSFSYLSRKVGNYLLLAKILQKQGNFGNKTQKLFECSLDISTACEGRDGVNTAAANIAIGQFHSQLAMKQSTVHTKRTQLLLAKSYIDEAVRIFTKIHSPTHPSRVAAPTLLSAILIQLSRVTGESKT